MYINYTYIIINNLFIFYQFIVHNTMSHSSAFNLLPDYLKSVVENTCRATNYKLDKPNFFGFTKSYVGILIVVLGDKQAVVYHAKANIEMSQPATYHGIDSSAYDESHYLWLKDLCKIIRKS